MKMISLIIASLLLAMSPVMGNSFPGQIVDFQVCEGGADGMISSTCEDVGILNINPQGQEIWLRAEIQVTPGAVRDTQPYAILISAMAASEFYWNGERVGANGQPGGDASSEVPGKMDARIYLPSELIQEGTNVISVRLSSFHNPVHVILPVHYIGIYRYQNPTLNRMRAYLPAMITAGGLALAAFYFGLAFALDRRQIGALLLALMSLATIGQLGAEASRGLISYDYPFHVVRLNYVIGFAFAFSLFLVAFVAWRFNRSWSLGSIGAAAGLGLLFIVTFPSYDMRTAMVFLAGCGVAAASLVPVLRNGGVAPRMIFGALIGFVALIFIRQGDFLDRDFYYAVLILSSILFVGELMARRKEADLVQQATTRAAKLELELLRRQISPHFLMNTLNVLSAWVEQDPKVSVHIIETLASECRALDDLSRRQLVPLSEELTLCETHLKLMSYRTEVAFELATTGDIVGKQVPPATILTLIENALSHNHYSAGAIFTLALGQRSAGTKLSFCAPAGERREQATKHDGMGMAYVKARLADAFGEKWSLDQGRDEANHWRVEIAYETSP